MNRLIEIVAQLRGPDGCPWDKEQSHLSLLPYLLEEAYEVIEEVQEARLGQDLADELGDLLLQVVLHAQIAKEEGRFGIEEVIQGISKKMIRRHPHVFGPAAKDQNQDQLTRQWDQIKAQEKQTPKLFADIPKAKPALLRAKKIGERAAKLGFDWPNTDGVLDKIKEELAEVEVELKKGDKVALESEIGDLLASVVSLARKCKINPELALQQSNNKFIRRFEQVESGIEAAKAQGQTLDLNQMEALWQGAKAGER
ncbi:MAG: nucleoside triphosphate pyrophosphohydrolase [Candidatus Lambdaproteobacteria bacterium RIFOXYD1_FULL_56_27]|uniref:Nucleoside triphosphate pyrophosphohydrolase n=1 Tax=Candidatus Lambdaproteobacteria bacterium RIFOXYD2_FULL_56_26 TaxID=1817773 RepID=A0A1F6GUQ4_9PROT|nr:MAG: nucleoside triphosphate pyrophosphohydrolase [Candidatus Lambdaproteobacteria bacterium RIFOXYD2_FULL_56_26]OGH02265.1 MAG: nucleoside triphosphate pyrophosphohydrolase [Candidatus Lambdaproteobacteria bacterium RIFOXYC1_FULL_56_13]OGH10034.1 MAG: nucleoside triphosphate pyrophosphohydrolase [Candidatus Lambdaproteobacteria bacterium RIFOXYD1_FULL_56_27]